MSRRRNAIPLRTLAADVNFWSALGIVAIIAYTQGRARGARAVADIFPDNRPLPPIPEPLP